MLPAVLGAGSDTQGFVRIRNNSDIAGEIAIHATDDTGQHYGPVTLALDARQTRHFNSDDLENGRPSKGLFGGVGDGAGMWRLDLETTLDIDPLAYIRTPDGFVTSMHQVAEVAEDDYGRTHYDIPLFNPGSNTASRSWLRVINPNPTYVFVIIEAIDDDGNPGAYPVEFWLAADVALQISSQALEQGIIDCQVCAVIPDVDTLPTGNFGDGKGKWALSIRSSHRLHVLSLLSTPSGHLTNLSR